MTLTQEDIEALGKIAVGYWIDVEPPIRFSLLMRGLIERHGNEWELTDKGAAALDDRRDFMGVRV